MQHVGVLLLAAAGTVTAAAPIGTIPAGTFPPGTFPPGTGQPQVQAACGPCHAITVVTTARKSPTEWERLVEAMITRGARVSDADFDIIVDYLIRNFSVAKDVAAANSRQALPNE